MLGRWKRTLAGGMDGHRGAATGAGTAAPVSLPHLQTPLTRMLRCHPGSPGPACAGYQCRTALPCRMGGCHPGRLPAGTDRHWPLVRWARAPHIPPQAPAEGGVRYESLEPSGMQPVSQWQPKQPLLAEPTEAMCRHGSTSVLMLSCIPFLALGLTFLTSRRSGSRAAGSRFIVARLP